MKDYLRSKVARSALYFTALGIVTFLIAWWIPSAWWISYLQDLSTTFFGIAATVWLINLVVERETARLAADLRKPTMEAASRSLQHFLGVPKPWLPDMPAPGRAQLHRFKLISRRVDRTVRLCDAVTPNFTEGALQKALVTLRETHQLWVERLEELEANIRMDSSPSEIEVIFSHFKTLTDLFEKSAKVLADQLSGSVDESSPTAA